MAADAPALIGRDDLLRAGHRAVVEGARLLSVVGRPGVGTSRVAREVLARCPGPVHAVDLDDATDVAEYLARGLQVLELSDGGQSTREAVVAHLHEHGCTVLMDGCSDRAVARDVASALLAEVPGLRLLTAGTGPLGLPDEHVLTVPALPVPAHDSDPACWSGSPAVAMFLSVASRAARGVDLTGDLEQVAEVCRRLDGVPAALALAAGRVALLRPVVMLREMDRVGARELVGLPVETETVRTLDLLDDDARAVTRALATTVGGAALADVGALVPDLAAEPLLAAVGRLVDLQLAVAEPERGRVALTGGTAEHTARREAGSPAWERAVKRHGAHYAAQARAFARRPHGTPMDGSWLLDHRNRLSALEALRSEQDRPGALRLAVDAMPGFEHRGDVDAGRRLLGEVLSQVPESTSGACIQAHLWLGRLEAERTDGVRTASAWEHFSAALRLARERGDLVIHLEALNAVCENQVILEDGVQHCEDAVAEALALTAADGLEFGRAVFLCWHSANLHRRHRYAEAAVAIAEAVTIARQYADLRLVMSFAIVHWQLPAERRPDVGVPTLPELLTMADEQGDVRTKGWIWTVAVNQALEDDDDATAVAHSLGMLVLARRTQQPPLARQVLVAAVRLLSGHGEAGLVVTVSATLAPHTEHLVTHLPPRFVAALEQAVGTAVGSLAPAARDAADRTGAGLDVWGALDLVEPRLRRLAEALRPAGLAQTAAAQPHPLTTREFEVLQALAHGWPNKQVARELGISAKTVGRHCEAIYLKLGVRNRTEAVAEGLRRALVRRGQEQVAPAGGRRPDA